MTHSGRAPAAVAVGDTHPARVIGPITQTDIVRFAGAGGDFNPLHHDPEFAARAGFPRPIAMGQFQAGLLAGWVSDWLGVEHLRSLEVRFVAPLMIGDAVTVGGEVVSVEQREAGQLATVELRATKDDGSLVVTGRADVVVSAS
ncbi:MaoC family dehydratase [Intrasporangium chromatireducens]|uniref:MaoC family dehydratase n=1 Tax=Intrasporangium chromatireducens TaxID=1386088 RepID=UPI0004BBFE37|nr:MaoC family dehydratase [Intrasporangium chromatireducens]